jgi:hypothetical protein
MEEVEYMRCPNCNEVGLLSPCGLCIYYIPSEFERDPAVCSGCNYVFTLSSAKLCASCEIIQADNELRPKARIKNFYIRLNIKESIFVS